MANEILTAMVSPVKIGDAITVEGLKLEDGRYAIAVQQVATVFQLRHDNVQRDVKALLGKDSSFVKVKTNREKVESKRVRSSENAILLSDFLELILNLFDKGNSTAKLLTRALVGVSLEQLFADAFQDVLAPRDRQIIINRILAIPDPWVRMYSKEMCDIAFGWFGAQFYWDYCYNFLTPEEKIFLNEVNPVVNGERLQTIHQHLAPEVKDRLRPKVDQLSVLLLSCGSRQEFLTCFNRLHGFDQQSLNLGV